MSNRSINNKNVKRQRKPVTGSGKIRNCFHFVETKKEKPIFIC